MSNIMVKRPPSEDLIDLHVFVVPIESWLGKYSVAYNNVALQSTSGGFIRVYPHATLQIVRELIEEQLETDVIPDHYVFLRSVGRCLAIVNQNQEKTLKAKHFLPPVAFSPEIFILPGTHEWIASLRKQTKSIVVNGDIALEDEYRLGSNDYFRKETSDSYPRSEQYSEDGYINSNRHDSREDAPTQRPVSDPASPPYDNQTSQEGTSDGTRDPSEMLPEGAQLKRNRRHLIDVIKAKQKVPGKSNYRKDHQNNNRYGKETEGSNGRYQSPSYETNNNDSSTSDDKEGSVNRVGSSEEDMKIDRLNGLEDPGKKGYSKDMRNNENRDESQHKTSPQVSKQRKENTNGENSRSDRFDVSPRTTLSEGEMSGGNGKKEKDAYSLSAEKDEAQKRQRSETFPRGGPAIQVLHPEIVNNQTSPLGLNRPSPIPSANVIHSTLTMDNYGRASEQKFVKPDKPAIEVEEGPESQENDVIENENEDPQSEIPEDKSQQPARTPNPEDLRRIEEEKKRIGDEKRRMEEMKKNIDNDAMQMMKDMEELLQRKKEEEEKRKEEEERRKKEEKERAERKKNEAAQLRDQLIKIREARIERQKQREGLMKNARELKAKVTAKRGPEMSIWESKYQAEKQRAAILEEELGNLKSELAASQKKLLKSLEQKDSDEPSEQKSPRTIVGPSQLNNLKNEVRRLNKEKDRVEEDIQKTKRKLLVESQQKATAHQQLKEMRRDKKASSVKAEAVSTPRTKLSNAEQ